MNVLLVINFVAAKKIIIYSIKHVFDCDNYNCSIFYDYDSDQYYCSRLNLLYLHMTFVCIQVLSACLYTCICLLDRCLRCSTNKIIIIITNLLSHWDSLHAKFGLLSPGKASCDRVALPNLESCLIYFHCFRNSPNFEL